MNHSAPVRTEWPARRWAMLVGTLLVLHFAGLWWFGAREPSPARVPERVPYWILGGPATARLWPLLDPTLFVHGHSNSFSGPAWMEPPVVAYQPSIPLEPPRFLIPTAARMARSFQNAWTPRGWDPSPLALRVEPLPYTRALVPRSPLTDRPSRLVLGEWSRPVQLRTLPPSLPGWSAPDLLTNTVVRVLVEPTGRVVSAVVLVSSGWEPADRQALSLARQLEFEFPDAKGSTPGDAGELVRGVLIFQWQTLPPQPQATGPG